MTNAFAPRPVEDFEDEFDLDMGYVASGPAAGVRLGDDPDAPYAPGQDARGIDDEATRPPLQFTTPAVTAASAAPARPAEPFEGQVPAVAGFNPVGDLVAGASAAFSPPALGGAFFFDR